MHPATDATPNPAATQIMYFRLFPSRCVTTLASALLLLDDAIAFVADTTWVAVREARYLASSEQYYMCRVVDEKVLVMFAPPYMWLSST